MADGPDGGERANLYVILYVSLYVSLYAAAPWTQAWWAVNRRRRVPDLTCQKLPALENGETRESSARMVSCASPTANILERTA